MENIFKRILSMLLVFITVVSVMLSATACADNGNDGDSDGSDLGDTNGGDTGDKSSMSVLEFFELLFGGAKGEDDPDDKGADGRADFIEFLGGVSETFEGAVSEESYESAEEAAVAFVSNEVAGDSDLSIVSAESKGEVEVSSINIPDEYRYGIVSIKEYEVEYYLTEGAAIMSADTHNSNKKAKVYIIKYESDWKYFAPAPITGDTISKSYYDSVFNYEKYKNCTFKSEATMEMEVVVNGMGQKMTTEVEVTQLIKYADGKIYLEITDHMSADASGMEYEVEDSAIKAYIESVDGELICYVDFCEGNGWEEADSLSTIGFSSLEELTPFYDQYLDYTYFTKTDYGFNIAEENAQRYVQQAYEELADYMSGDSSDINMYSEYYVSDGTLSGARSDLDMNIDKSVMGYTITGFAKAVATITCTDYGTTVVEAPHVFN